VTDRQTDGRTDRRTELRWLRRAIAVPAVARKNRKSHFTDKGQKPLFRLVVDLLGNKSYNKLYNIFCLMHTNQVYISGCQLERKARSGGVVGEGQRDLVY